MLTDRTHKVEIVFHEKLQKKNKKKKKMLDFCKNRKGTNNYIFTLRIDFRICCFRQLIIKCNKTKKKTIKSNLIYSV